MNAPSSPSLSRVPHTVCRVREVAWWRAVLPCDRCQQPALAVWQATRVAVDIDLTAPVLLLVHISVHQCASCQHYFRAQPPFLRPDASYTNRVVAKAVAAVHADGMAVTRVAQRLARDFWVRPSEAMIRGWCERHAAGLHLEQDYTPWVVAEFSGILCVDEVYQQDLALLLAVDPAAPEGDRLVGYQLVPSPVDQAAMEAFLTRLRQEGIAPAEVITDGSTLYPAVLAKVWPAAMHQLCLFHETRHVTKAVQDVLKAARAALPQPPGRRGDGHELRGRPPKRRPATAMAADAPPTAGADYFTRRDAAVREVQALQRHGMSLRGIARQTGRHRRTIQRWLQEPTPPAGQDVPPGAPGATLSATTPPPSDAPDPAPQMVVAPAGMQRGDRAGAATEAVALAAPPAAGDVPAAGPGAPPAPWTDWDQVRAVRQQFRDHRFLFLRRPDHLSQDEAATLATLLAAPLDASVTLARRFLVDWYAIFRDDAGQRRAVEDAWQRYRTWRAEPASASVPPLHRIQEQLDAARFGRLSAFLRHPAWEATSNGAERMGRTFRHQQAPHFRLRTRATVDDALKVQACQRQAAATTTPPPAGRSGRGRRPRQGTPPPCATTVA